MTTETAYTKVLIYLDHVIYSLDVDVALCQDHAITAYLNLYVTVIFGQLRIDLGRTIHGFTLDECVFYAGLHDILTI